MIFSMTGFGSVFESFQMGDAQIQLSCELKCLNSKFLDLQIRSPRVYSSFDLEISKRIKQSLARGRLELYVTREVIEGSTHKLRVNSDELHQVYRALEQVRESLKIEQNVRLEHLLQHPDWLHSSEAPIELEGEKKFLFRLLDRVIEQVTDSRLKEGEALQRVLEEQLQDLDSVYSKIKNQNEVLVKNLRSRLKSRVEELMKDVKFDATRLEQEIAIWVARSDFQEEIDRLGHHLESFRSRLQEGGEVGRRLEFIVQEMHRELNTIGSKCSDSSWTTQVINMKSLVERMKEQIQNIE